MQHSVRAPMLARCKRRRRSANRARSCRRGAALVELAITLPLIVTIVFATIELSNLIYTRQSLQELTQECSRVAAQPGCTNSDVQDRLDEIAPQLGISGVRFVTDPPDISGLPPRTRIRVTVFADVPSNSIISGRFYPSNEVEANSFVVKEL